MWTRSLKLALFWSTVPFTIRGQIWARIGTNVGTIVEVGTISAYVSLSEGGFGPKFSKVGTIEAKLGPNLCNVGIIGAQIGPSGHYRGWMWSKGGFGHPIVW